MKESIGEIVIGALVVAGFVVLILVLSDLQQRMRRLEKSRDEAVR